MLKVSEGILKFENDFHRIFGLSLRDYQDFLARATGVFSFDIVKFDEWAHTQGYTEESDGSLRDWIKCQYGDDALSLIEEMIAAPTKGDRYSCDVSGA